MLSREENELLIRVGPGAPMGELMRRYWIPALLSEELPEPNSDPLPITLLGERLVAYRDATGRAGLLAEGCPHRGASLAYARSEETGLRCIYHGWKVDIEGNILETPPEPAGSTLRFRIKHVAYPAREAGDVLWVYMGPTEKMPVFPEWEWTKAPPERRVATKIFQDCNYTQGLEGSIDSVHSDYVHSSDIQGRPKDHSPGLEAQNTRYGFRYAAIRKPDQDADKLKYVRVTLFVAPFYVFIPPLRRGPGRNGEHESEIVVQQAWVPIDDYHNYFFTFACARKGLLPDHWRQHAAQFGISGRCGRPVRNRENGHLQDRAAMRAGNWSGIQGINSQDFAVVESMGPIYDRTKEHLGASDIAVIRYRRLMLDALRAFRDGAEPIGIDRSIPYDRLSSEERIVPIETPWQAVGAFAGEEVPEGSDMRKPL